MQVSRILTQIRDAAPGVFVLVSVAAVGHALGTRLPVAPLLVVVAVGAVLGIGSGRPARLGTGVELHSPVLKTAIALLGLEVARAGVVASGLILVVLAVGAAAVALVSVETITRHGLGVGNKTGSLLASGAALCGVSAIATVGESIDAGPERIAYAAAVILTFDAAALAVFPAVGATLDLPPRLYGAWAGLNVFSTGPAVAAGFAHGPVAGQWATATKLARNALIGVVAIGYALTYGTSRGTRLGSAVRHVPTFLIVFVLLALLGILGVVPSNARSVITAGVDWLFLIAFAGIGYELRPTAIRESDPRLALAVLLHLLGMSVVSLLVLSAVFG